MRYGAVSYLFGGISSGVLQDIINKFSNLYILFSSNKFLIDELNWFYEEIEEEIKTPEPKRATGRNFDASKNILNADRSYMGMIMPIS